MIGDKLVTEPHHTERGAEICKLLMKQELDRFCVTVAGESGAGKTETGFFHLDNRPLKKDKNKTPVH